MNMPVRRKEVIYGSGAAAVVALTTAFTMVVLQAVEEGPKRYQAAAQQGAAPQRTASR